MDAWTHEALNRLSATLTFAQTHDYDITEQYVDWGNNINFIFMRDQHSPPPLNNKLIGIITPTLSSWGIKIRHLLRTICWLGNNINFIFMRLMRDQNQEGKTSTPGKRPGCSEQVQTNLSNRTDVRTVTGHSTYPLVDLWSQRKIPTSYPCVEDSPTTRMSHSHVWFPKSTLILCTLREEYEIPEVSDAWLTRVLTIDGYMNW